MSNATLPHNYTAHDTGERHSVTGARTFELRRPDGSLVDEFYGAMLEEVLPEMDKRLREDNREQAMKPTAVFNEAEPAQFPPRTEEQKRKGEEYLEQARRWYGLEERR